MLSHGAEVNSKTLDGWTPLHSAANWGNVHEVNELMEHGALVNALTRGRQTPLHLALANSESADTISVILSHPDIDLTLTNCVGETAKDIALRTRFHHFFT